MRSAWISSSESLRTRMIKPFQVANAAPEAEMPPYMESFLAHLRLLVGVPFENMIPDPRMLPDESIRFFYLDRSWTDRLVDGAIAVGKIGTREHAHHQAHNAPVTQQLDLTERGVRDLQRGKSFVDVKKDVSGQQPPAGIITGFLLRSGVVSGWPTMDVRAYATDIPEPLEPASAAAQAQQLRTLRLERLSPAILFALFDGIPQLVFLEEPHHGVQFGVHAGRTPFEIDLRDATGHQIRDGANNPFTQSVPIRAGGNRVIGIAHLRASLISQRATHTAMPEQKGSSAFAIEVLNPPWRQRFEGTVDHAEKPGTSGGFVSIVAVANRVADVATKNAFETAITTQAISGRRG
jgi:hypothetical protein